MDTLSCNVLLIKQVESFHTDVAHLLNVIHGRAWVTLIGSQDQVNPDIFLTDGQALQVAAFQHLVIEPWPRHLGDELSVQWIGIS